MEKQNITYEREKNKDRIHDNDPNQREQNRQHKKKKKHKEDRRSRSNDSKRQKKHKRKHSRSRSDSNKKHKKHHKDHKQFKQNKDRKEHKDGAQKKSKSPGRTDRQNRQRRDRSRSENRERKHRHRSDSRQQRRYQQNSRKQEKKDDNQYETKRREPREIDDKDPYFEERRQIERVRKNDPQKAERMQQELEKQIIFDAKKRQYELMKEKFRQAQKQLEEAKREDHTILVYCLPLKAKQKDIWNFFSRAQCGKIRDIRIIRDQRSGKSKGVAYVEFYTSESVEKALTMKQRPIQVKGRQFTGLKIQHSQAEKNRAAAAAKQMKVTKQVDPYEQEREQKKRLTKVQVRGLDGRLAEMSESEIKQIFEPFGKIDYVDIHRDPQTGKCKGFAFIQYQNVEDAKRAVKEMDGMELLKGFPISVSTVTMYAKGDASTGDDYLHSQGSKMALMNSLARDAPSYSNLQRPPISTVPYPYIVMSNMFKMEGTSPAFFQGLKKEVTEAFQEFGIIEKIFIQKNNQGNIWIKYSDTVSSSKAQENMNSKFFDGRKVFCYFVTEETWNKRVSI